MTTDPRVDAFADPFMELSRLDRTAGILRCSTCGRVLLDTRPEPLRELCDPFAGETHDEDDNRRRCDECGDDMGSVR